MPRKPIGAANGMSEKPPIPDACSTTCCPFLSDDLDVVRIYGRYDGGNDEGFAWLDHAITRDGRKLSRDDISATGLKPPRAAPL